MARLMNSSQQNKILVENLKIASSLGSRMKGLLGTKSLGTQEALWIQRCNSIHTFFMNYSIDCVFVDEDLSVKALVKDVRPGRFVFPIWGATSVIEMPSGHIERLGIILGDQLHVGH